MEKTTFPELEFHNVTQDSADKLRAYLENEDGAGGVSKNSGFAETPCFSAKYDFSPKSGVLIIEPVHLMSGLRGHRLKRIINDVLNAGTASTTSLTVTDPTPTPHACATYNWVIGYMQNNTAFTLTYSAQNTSHGNIISTLNKIPSGSSPTDQGDDGIFQNQSPKDSTVGCYGDISWNIDGSTSVTIHYGVNTLSTTSATVSLSGPNAALYDATMDLRTNFYYACAFIFPTVTLSKVT